MSVTDPPEDNWRDIVDQPDPRHTLETPASSLGGDWVLDAYGNRSYETDLEALMMTAPGHDPPDSTESLHRSSDRLEWLVENELNETERGVIEATVYAGHSIRKAAQILGLPPSTVHRLKMSALERLERLMDERQ